MPQFGGASEKCNVCNKTVYLAEKIVVEDKEDKKTFHKTCLKCSHCKATLSLGNYASMNGVMYCKPHFKQLFATKGNYDEGFGKEKLTSKWTPNTAAPGAGGPGAFVPVEKTEVEKTAEKKTPSSIAAKFQMSSEKCDVCGKAVYATEKIVIEEKEGKKVFHKPCLKCSHCQVILTLGNYAAMNGITYCKPHFKQLFATKGNYDEGFGKEKHTTKWDPQAGAAPATFVPVEKSDVPKGAAGSTEVASKFKNISAADKCAACGKTVYLTEKVVVEDKEDKKLLHKSCLRCSHCQVVLSLGNYASMNGVMYCKPHFKQLFATKGNYDEGFGKEKHSAKWIEQEDKPEESGERREESHHDHSHSEESHHHHEHSEESHHDHQKEEREREEKEREEREREEREREERDREEREREEREREEREREESHQKHEHHDHEHEHHDGEHKHEHHEHEHHEHEHEHHDHHEHEHSTDE